MSQARIELSHGCFDAVCSSVVSCEPTRVYEGATMNQSNRLKTMVLIVSLFFAFFLMFQSFAHARAGGGRSSGSRGFTSGSGFRSYQGTTSRPAQPTQPAQQPGVAQPTPAQPGSPGLGPGFFSGLGGGLLGGMIGSLLFGGMAGARGSEGTGAFGFGDIVIILFILAIVFFVVRRFRTRHAMEMTSAGAATAPYHYSYNQPVSDIYKGPSPREEAISLGLRHIAEMDPTFNEASFKEQMEDNFFKIQSAWTKRDLTSVKNLLTPQMEKIFQDDIDRYVAQKQLNRLENIAVRQVEIVDAVQDQGEEYITVKFLASLLDYVVDETSGKTVSGDSSDPVKFLEYWTFTRKVGERNWLLAGITQEEDYR